MKRIDPESVRPDDLDCDVLVVGGGGAGLRSALAAADAGARVLLATKGHLGSAGVTATACSDRMAFHATLPHTAPIGPDAWRYHADDVYRIGGCVSDWDLAAILARESAVAFGYLDSLGVPFVHRDGRPDQFLTDGSEYARALYTGPYTANHIHQALLARLEATPVAVLEECLVAEIARTPAGRAVGAIACHERTGSTIAIPAGAVVLATGGAGEAFATNVFPPGMTGDGYALALRAGSALANFEFVQLGLCSTATKLACSGSIMRALPRVVDDAGGEILRASFLSPKVAYDTLFQKGANWPVSAEHASHAIDVAVSRARAVGRRVFLDFAANPTALDLAALDSGMVGRFQNVAAFYATAEAASSPFARLNRINPESVDWLRERGIDLARGDRVEIAPAAQHFQGGVRIRQRAETTVPGVFAAGECAGGQHGANRPGGHALLDGQVFGRIAGAAAAAFARDNPTARQGVVAALDAAVSSDPLRSGRSASSARRAIQAAVDRAAGVIRTEVGLADALAEVRAVGSDGVGVHGDGAAAAIEARNLALVAEALIAAALARRESRGPHLRFATVDAAAPLPRDDAEFRALSEARLIGNRVVVGFVAPIRPAADPSDAINERTGG